MAGIAHVLAVLQPDANAILAWCGICWNLQQCGMLFFVGIVGFSLTGDTRKWTWFYHRHIVHHENFHVFDSPLTFISTKFPHVIFCLPLRLNRIWQKKDVHWNVNKSVGVYHTVVVRQRLIECWLRFVQSHGKIHGITNQIIRLTWISF